MGRHSRGRGGSIKETDRVGGRRIQIERSSDDDARVGYYRGLIRDRKIGGAPTIVKIPATYVDWLIRIVHKLHCLGACEHIKFIDDHLG
jgi:hypothetical protein